MTFIEQIYERARSHRRTVVLPESTDPRVLRAAAAAQRRGLAQIVLLGRLADIKVADPALDLSGILLYDPASDPRLTAFAERLYELRRGRGMTPEQAAEQVADPICFGMLLLDAGLVDGLVAGAVSTTAQTLRPALQIIRTRPDAGLASAFFMMQVPDRRIGANGVLLFADCGLNADPTAEQLAEIAGQSAESFRRLTGCEPRIGMASYSTMGSASGETTLKMAAAAELAKRRWPALTVAGELQADACLVPAVAAQKAPGSAIQGDANILIFPDLNTGNIAYKLVNRLARAEAYGPLLQGLAKPVNDLSRGATPEEILGVIAITAVQAQAAAPTAPQTGPSVFTGPARPDLYGSAWICRRPG